MNLIYSGKTKEFTSELEEKIAGKLAKLGKMSEQRGEREVHLTHQMERHLHKVELVMNLYDHGLVGEGIDADLQTSICQAIDKLEKQVVKLRARWRDTHRISKAVTAGKESWDDQSGSEAAENSALSQPNGTGKRPRIHRVNYTENRKPITLEEAVLEMENDLDYLVYQDSERNCLSVLVRRPDGDLDLIES